MFCTSIRFPATVPAGAVPPSTIVVKLVCEEEVDCEELVVDPLLEVEPVFPGLEFKPT